MIVFDSSALLAFLRAEPGAEIVESRLHGDDPIAVGAANWSETAQKVEQRNDEWPVARQVMKSYGLKIEPVSEVDAETAALMWQPGAGLSLADRLCIAVGGRLDAEIVTADAAWGSSGRITQIR